jgi:hypothetical protein
LSASELSQTFVHRTSFSVLICPLNIFFGDLYIVCFHIKKIELARHQWLTPVVPTYLGGGDGLRPTQGNSLRDLPPSPKNNQSKKDWRCGSSSSVPTLQAQGPEFKLQSHQKAQKKPKTNQPKKKKKTKLF